MPAVTLHMGLYKVGLISYALLVCHQALNIRSKREIDQGGGYSPQPSKIGFFIHMTPAGMYEKNSMFVLKLSCGCLILIAFLAEYFVRSDFQSRFLRYIQEVKKFYL